MSSHKFNLVSFIILLCMIGLTSCSDGKDRKNNLIINKAELKTELDSIMIRDQKYRKMMNDTSAKYGWESEPMKSLWKKQSQLDSANLKKVLEIIEEIQVYPGDSIVGFPTRKSAFFVLQHAPDSIQEKYLPMIMNAAKSGQLDKNLAAMYHDRYLLHRGLPQIYGSQFLIKRKLDSLTGEQIVTYELYKLKDSTKVDSLRSSMGMIPLKDYLNLH